jgi:hypothetical protein
MAGAWVDLTSQGQTGVESSRWLIEHLLQAEQTDRALRSISYQLKSARFPVHRDLAGFDFSQSKVDERLITELAELAFTEVAHNVVFIGGTGTGKSHLATALGVSGITRHGRRVRCFSTVDLVNALEQEKAAGKAGKLAFSHVGFGSAQAQLAHFLPIGIGRRAVAYARNSQDLLAQIVLGQCSFGAHQAAHHRQGANRSGPFQNATTGQARFDDMVVKFDLHSFLPKWFRFRRQVLALESWGDPNGPSYKLCFPRPRVQTHPDLA